MGDILHTSLGHMRNMKIVFLKKHYLWSGALWFVAFVSSLLIRVEMRYWGGWEGEYSATYGFPFAVAKRQYDMWIPFFKQFDLISSGILLNFVFTALVTVGIATLVLSVLQRRNT